MRIGIDVDGVVADHHTPWLRRLADRVGRSVTWTPDDLTQWEFWHDLGVEKDLVVSSFTPDIYNDVLPFEGAAWAMEELRKAGHEVVFVTSSYTQEEFSAKVYWLLQNDIAKLADTIHAIGPWAEYKSKGDPRLNLDALLDDHVTNLEEFYAGNARGFVVLMTRPHNRAVLTVFKRVRHLADFVAWAKYHQVPKVKGTAIDEVMDSYNYTADHCAGPADGACWTHPPVGGSTAPVTGPAITFRSTSPLPEDPAERKATPIMTGVLDYFPAAIAEVAKISLGGNKQHFAPGTPLHWDRSKSTDHADSAVRHLMDRGKLDTDGKRHSAKAAWRALANLQQELEDEGAPISRASKSFDTKVG